MNKYIRYVYHVVRDPEWYGKMAMACLLICRSDVARYPVDMEFTVFAFLLAWKPISTTFAITMSKNDKTIFKHFSAYRVMQTGDDSD